MFYAFVEIVAVACYPRLTRLGCGGDRAFLEVVTIAHFYLFTMLGVMDELVMACISRF